MSTKPHSCSLKIRYEWHLLDSPLKSCSAGSYFMRASEFSSLLKRTKPSSLSIVEHHCQQKLHPWIFLMKEVAYYVGRTWIFFSLVTISSQNWKFLCLNSSDWVTEICLVLHEAVFCQRHSVFFVAEGPVGPAREKFRQMEGPKY